MDSQDKTGAHKNDDCVKLDVMLREYAAAQSSAEHYNSLLWQVVSIFTAANAVLAAGAGSVLAAPEIRSAGLAFLVAASVAGIIMNVACLRFAGVFRDFQNQKLIRCQHLEATVESICAVQMSQHRGLQQHPGVHRLWYRILEGAFIVLWAALLAFCIRQF